jgi:hypothetical protein
MDKKILVPLGKYDRPEDMIPYIENVAQPGMKVAFLFRYPVDGFVGSKTDGGVPKPSETRELVEHYTWAGNVERADRKARAACEALRAKGFGAEAEIYAGSLKEAVKVHTASGDVRLIMTRAGIGRRIAGFLNGSSSLFDLFKRPVMQPVLLIHPGMAA